jgi:Mn2+/Fe2+ NRAMP family transporter
MNIFVNVAYAACTPTASNPNPICSSTIFQKINSQILTPFIFLLFAIALFYFVWGMVRFIWSMSRGDMEGKGKGQRHMIWGIIGLSIMASVFGILNFIFGTVTGDGTATGITGQTIPTPPEVNGLN